MKLSLFSAALLLLAAGSEANPMVKPGSAYRHRRSKRQDTCVVRSTNKTIAVPAGKSGAGAGSPTPLKIDQSVGGAGSTTPGTGSTTPGTGSTTPGTSSTTPGGNDTASSANAEAQPGKIKTDPS